MAVAAAAHRASFPLRLQQILAGSRAISPVIKVESKLQIAIRETRPMVEAAVKQVYAAVLPPRTMVVADLGCSAGPNTLLFISSVLSSIVAAAEQCEPPSGGDDDHVELQFVLNDLPGNDFNQLFRSVEEFRRPDTTGESTHPPPPPPPPPPPYYVMGLAESYYNRLFPRQSVHLFHSSYCLHWRSQEPEGLEAWRKPCLNEDNIYIARTTPPSVVKQFQRQFQKDFSLFLKLRHEELVHGGRMVLIFLGRKNEDVYSGDLNQLFALVAAALQSLVSKGLVEKEKLESFNLPVYGPSVGEVEELVITQTGLQFSVDLIKQFEMNWDPFDDSEGDDDVVEDSARSSVNVAKLIRSVLKTLIVRHFGEAVLDACFAEFTRLVAQHLGKEKTKFTTIAMCLKKE